MITQVELKSRLKYDPDTGIFTWLTFLNNNKLKVGDVAGSRMRGGYRGITIDGKKYSSHILAWLYVYGYVPIELDHKDRIRDHNWISNLRETTRSLNNMNSSIRSDNTSGFKGVSKNGNKFQASIGINGKSEYLGRFNTPEEAHAEYCSAASFIYGEFFNPGY